MNSDSFAEHLREDLFALAYLNDLMIFLRSLITEFMTIDPPITNVETDAPKKVAFKAEIYSNNEAIRYPMGFFQSNGKLEIRDLLCYCDFFTFRLEHLTICWLYSNILNGFIFLYLLHWKWQFKCIRSQVRGEISSKAHDKCWCNITQGPYFYHINTYTFTFALNFFIDFPIYQF